MTTVQTLTRDEARSQRDSVVTTLVGELGTSEREVLRDMLPKGHLSAAEAAQVERLQTLDHLLAEE